MSAAESMPVPAETVTTTAPDDAALDAKFAAAAARVRANPPKLPGRPVVDVVTGFTREATCSCGATFPQYRFGATWSPDVCGTCVARENAERAQREAEEREQERRRRALEALDIPLLYKNATLENFRVPSADSADARIKARVVQMARRYLGMWDARQSDELTFPQIVIFMGESGTGKNHVAWAIARTVAVEYGDTVKFTVLSDCVRDLREAWQSRRGDGVTESARLAEYRRPALLIIDEVSDHAFYGQPTQHLYDLVAWREQRLLPTILTTNASRDSLAAMLGPALVSRAAGWSGLWDFGTVDYRLERRRALSRSPITPEG